MAQHDYPIAVAAFYRFTRAAAPDEVKEQLRAVAESSSIFGTVILAQEGINGTIAGEAEAVRGFLVEAAAAMNVDSLPVKFSRCSDMPFSRMKIKVKKEIVTLRAGLFDPNERTGTHVPPEAWNDLIRDPEVFLIDTRNSFEYAMGSFEGAADPHTRKFCDFPAWVERELDPARHKKVAMFCTGGIRCEKATAYMLDRGFEQVYQLEGGILNYLEHIPAHESLWRGDCFVFDDRVALDHSLHPSSTGHSEAG